MVNLFIFHRSICQRVLSLEEYLKGMFKWFPSPHHCAMSWRFVTSENECFCLECLCWITSRASVLSFHTVYIEVYQTKWKNMNAYINNAETDSPFQLNGPFRWWPRASHEIDNWELNISFNIIVVALSSRLN